MGSKQKPVVFFFHGLNTFGDDLLHFGPVNLGRMDRFVTPALESGGLKVYSINGVGSGSPESQARLAASQISGFKDLQPESNVTLIGNSMGGLVTRALARLWKIEPGLNSHGLKIEKLISWGTPHQGTRVADLALKVSKKHPTFMHYSTTAIGRFNELHPLNAFAPEFCFTCAVGWREVSPYFYPYFFVHSRSHPPRPSDGFISVENQTWGRVRGTFRLDHFGQTGFSMIFPTRAQRERSRKEFTKLCDAMAALVKSPVEISDTAELSISASPRESGNRLEVGRDIFRTPHKLPKRLR